MIPPKQKAELEKERKEILEFFRDKEARETEEMIQKEFFTKKDLEFLNTYLQFLKQLNIYLNHFPRHEKFALSSRIRNNAYEIYELLTEIRRKYYKKTSLTHLDIAFETLKMQIFLAWNLGYFDYKKEEQDFNATDSLRRYGVLQKMLVSIGRQIGALIKTSQQSEKW